MDVIPNLEHSGALQTLASNGSVYHAAVVRSDGSLGTTTSSVVGDGSNEYCRTFQFVLNTVVIGLLCLLGFTGNTVSILVLQKDRHNRVAVFLLQALAVADNSVLVLSFFALSIAYGLMPLLGHMDKVTIYIYPYLVQWVNPLGSAAQCSVIWITVLLAVNRYVAICRPFTSRQWLTMKSTRIQVAAVVFTSLALNAPFVYYYRNDKVYLPCPNNQSNSSVYPNSSEPFSDLSTTHDCKVIDDSNFESAIYYATYDWTTAAAANISMCVCRRKKNVPFEVGYQNAFYTSIALILPLVLTVGFNFPLVRQIQKSKQRMIENSLSYRGRQENNITRVMIVVIMVMTVCHTPDRVVSVIRFFSKPEDVRCPYSLFYAMNVTNLLVMTNSSVDFLIYYIFRRRFRTILRNKLCCCRPPDVEGERGSLAPGGADSTREYKGTVRDGSGRSLPPAVGNIIYAPLVALRKRTLLWNSLRKERRTAKVASASSSNGVGTHKHLNNINEEDQILVEERNGHTVL